MKWFIPLIILLTSCVEPEATDEKLSDNREPIKKSTEANRNSGEITDGAPQKLIESMDIVIVGEDRVEYKTIGGSNEPTTSSETSEDSQDNEKEQPEEVITETNEESQQNEEEQSEEVITETNEESQQNEEEQSEEVVTETNEESQETELTTPDQASNVVILYY